MVFWISTAEKKKRVQLWGTGEPSGNAFCSGPAQSFSPRCSCCQPRFQEECVSPQGRTHGQVVHGGALVTFIRLSWFSYLDNYHNVGLIMCTEFVKTVRIHMNLARRPKLQFYGHTRTCVFVLWGSHQSVGLITTSRLLCTLITPVVFSQIREFDFEFWFFFSL